MLRLILENCDFFATIEQSANTLSATSTELLLKGNKTANLKNVFYLFSTVSSSHHRLFNPVWIFKNAASCCRRVIFFIYSFISLFILHLVCFPVAPLAKMKIIHQSRIGFWFILPPSLPHPHSQLARPASILGAAVLIKQTEPWGECSWTAVKVSRKQQDTLKWLMSPCSNRPSGLTLFIAAAVAAAVVAAIAAAAAAIELAAAVTAL